MPGPTWTGVERALAAFDWDKWRRELTAQYGDWYDTTLTDAASTAARQYRATWHSDDPFVRRFAAKYVGERITQIEDTTRNKVAATVRRNLEAADGAMSTAQLGQLIAETFAEFSRSRAQMIARTETAIVVNHGRLMGYAAAGFEFVEVSDGEECDDACIEADGAIWSIEDALANPIEHPNCVRSFAPIAREDLPADFEE